MEEKVTILKTRDNRIARPKRKPLSLYDFGFTLSGYGRYKVTYTSASGKSYTATITDMTVIDATKHSDSPRAKDLKILKAICISNYL